MLEASQLALEKILVLEGHKRVQPVELRTALPSEHHGKSLQT